MDWKFIGVWTTALGFCIVFWATIAYVIVRSF
jgi:hypothetical protein